MKIGQNIVLFIEKSLLIMKKQIIGSNYCALLKSNCVSKVLILYRLSHSLSELQVLTAPRC